MSAAEQLRDDQKVLSHCVTWHNLAIIPATGPHGLTPRRNLWYDLILEITRKAFGSDLPSCSEGARRS